MYPPLSASARHLRGFSPRAGARLRCFQGDDVADHSPALRRRLMPTLAVSAGPRRAQGEP
jgi:hypothetical protein